MKIFLAGGAGYIGSHTAVELLEAGHSVVCADNFSNSSPKVIDRIGEITGKKAALYEVDLCDRERTLAIFKKEKPDAVVHFAGFKAVGESVSKPLSYYDNNINCTLSLLSAMKECGVRNIVFSSSATVYGNPASVPIREDFPTGGTTNPYGTTKYIIERILIDAAAADKSLNIAVLRYFNPIGAHESGLIGEDPRGIPNNLLPYIARVAVGALPKLMVYGGDYPTKDGTGVRDYIHVTDLARGHLAALNRLGKSPGLFICNLGTGRGYSVLEILRAYEKACGKKLPYEITARRPGDIAECYADPSFAERELKWRAEMDIDRMCRDSYNFQRKNADGCGV